MLVYAHGYCGKCKTPLNGQILQEVSVSCVRCGTSFILCGSCKTQKCLKCGGKLESELDKAEKEGFLF